MANNKAVCVLKGDNGIAGTVWFTQEKVLSTFDLDLYM